jgi:hypothetical protein
MITNLEYLYIALIYINGLKKKLSDLYQVWIAIPRTAWFHSCQNRYL